MTESYHLVTNLAILLMTLDSSTMADFLAKDGRLLLPMLDLIENVQVAIDDLIDVMEMATIKAVMMMSAAKIAGAKRQGKKSYRDVVYHGSQRGRVPLRESELNVEKPRIRKKNSKQAEPGEVEIPAYKAIRENRCPGKSPSGSRPLHSPGAFSRRSTFFPRRNMRGKSVSVHFPIKNELTPIVPSKKN